MRNFCDSHTDFMTKLKTIDEKEEYVKSIHDLGARKILSAIFTTDKNIGIEKLKIYKSEIDELNQKFDNILYFSVEDLGSVKPNELEKLVKLNPISVTLTWNKKNIYGGGAESEAHLTQQGIRACKLFEENNIQVDTAHLNQKSFWGFCQFTQKPIFNSHTNILTLHKHQRNLSDDQIKRIVDSNGFMGLTIYQKFISQNKICCKDIALQFTYLADKFGIDNFGIGSDFFGFDEKFLPADLKSYKDLKNLENEMKNLGFSINETNKLLCDNFIRFLHHNNILKNIDK